MTTEEPKMTNKLRGYIDYVIEYVGDSTNDWFKIKMEIINRFPPRYRKLFSRRHYSTKKHILNAFDYEVINYWENETGIKLFIDPDKLHPDDWPGKPRGWWMSECFKNNGKEKANQILNKPIGRRRNK